MKLLVVLVSERVGRAGQTVADWFLPIAEEAATIDFVDLKELALPLEMEGVSPKQRVDLDYPRAEDKRWSDHVSSADAVIFIMPEYNHGYSASQKNAIDHIYNEWKAKPIGFVAYGVEGAPYALKSLVPVMAKIEADPVFEPHVGIPAIWAAFDENGAPKDSVHEQNARALLGELQKKATNK